MLSSARRMRCMARIATIYKKSNLKCTFCAAMGRVRYKQWRKTWWIFGSQTMWLWRAIASRSIRSRFFLTALPFRSFVKCSDKMVTIICHNLSFEYRLTRIGHTRLRRIEFLRQGKKPLSNGDKWLSCARFAKNSSPLQNSLWVDCEHYFSYTKKSMSFSSSFTVAHFRVQIPISQVFAKAIIEWPTNCIDSSQSDSFYFSFDLQWNLRIYIRLCMPHR